MIGSEDRSSEDRPRGACFRVSESAAWPRSGHRKGVTVRYDGVVWLAVAVRGRAPVFASADQAPQRITSGARRSLGSIRFLMEQASRHQA